MTKANKKYLANMCNAKDIVCTACRKHKENACNKCPIVNIMDDELRRLQGNETKAVKEMLNVFESDID